MKFWLNWGLFGSVLWAAAGCCCYSQCGSGCGGYGYGYGGYGYPSTYNTVPTGGYSTMAQSQVQTQSTAANIPSMTQQQSVASGNIASLPNANSMNPTMIPSQSGTPCPCETGGMVGGTYYQDANGMTMPMEGMVYDASVEPTQVITTPTADPSVYQTPPAALQPVPQPQIGIPVGTDGLPLAPPAK